MQWVKEAKNITHKHKTRLLWKLHKFAGFYFETRTLCKMARKEKGRWRHYVKENTNWVSSAYSIVGLQEVVLESIGISCFDYIHSHFVQCFNGLVDGSMLFVIVRIVESTHNGSERKIDIFSFLYIREGCLQDIPGAPVTKIWRHWEEICRVIHIFS